MTDSESGFCPHARPYTGQEPWCASASTIAETLNSLNLDGETVLVCTQTDLRAAQALSIAAPQLRGLIDTGNVLLLGQLDEEMRTRIPAWVDTVPFVPLLGWCDDCISTARSQNVARRELAHALELADKRRREYDALICQLRNEEAASLRAIRRHDQRLPDLQQQHEHRVAELRREIGRITSRLESLRRQTPAASKILAEANELKRELEADIEQLEKTTNDVFHGPLIHAKARLRKCERLITRCEQINWEIAKTTERLRFAQQHLAEELGWTTPAHRPARVDNSALIAELESEVTSLMSGRQELERELLELPSPPEQRATEKHSYSQHHTFVFCSVSSAMQERLWQRGFDIVVLEEGDSDPLGSALLARGAKERWVSTGSRNAVEKAMSQWDSVLPQSGDFDDELRMLAQRIAALCTDYKGGVSQDDVMRWVAQFDDFFPKHRAAVRLPILREMDHVLARTYFSRERARELVSEFVTARDWDWSEVNFARTQEDGNSQPDLLRLFSEVLSQEYGLDIEDCGAPDGIYLYVDDALYTGVTLLREPRGPDDTTHRGVHRLLASTSGARSLAVYHLISYERGERWVSDEMKRYASRHGFKWLGSHASQRFMDDPLSDPAPDTLRPRSIQGTNAGFYLENMEIAQPVLRRCSEAGGRVFSDEPRRSVLEQAFLRAGLYLCDPDGEGRLRYPLGYTVKGAGTFGFGAMSVTWRNCPTNAPLALWCNGVDEWMPLFRRRQERVDAPEPRFPAEDCEIPF